MFPIQEESSIVATLINMKFNSIARCVLVFLFFLSFLFFSIPSTKLREEMFTKKKEKLYAKLYRIIFVCSYYIIRFVNCFLKKWMHPVRIFLHFLFFYKITKSSIRFRSSIHPFRLFFLVLPSSNASLEKAREKKGRKGRKKLQPVLRAI